MTYVSCLSFPVGKAVFFYSSQPPAGGERRETERGIYAVHVVGEEVCLWP